SVTMACLVSTVASHSRAPLTMEEELRSWAPARLARILRTNNIATLESGAGATATEAARILLLRSIAVSTTASSVRVPVPHGIVNAPTTRLRPSEDWWAEPLLHPIDPGPYILTRVDVYGTQTYGALIVDLTPLLAGWQSRNYSISKLIPDEEVRLWFEQCDRASEADQPARTPSSARGEGRGVSPA
ncbi:MAG: hypothetical protein ACR2M1_16850, partial [Gemmatimonadaceae bacterium]